MTRNKGVRKFIGEFLLIVLGVLTALALESSWQDRLDRRLEKQLLGALRVELNQNAGELERWIELHGLVSNSLDSLITQLDGVPEGERVLVPDSVVAHVLRNPTYDADQASLEAALRSGHITLIQSSAIQIALARWDRLLQDAQEEEEKAMQLTISYLMPLMATQADLGPSHRFLAESNRFLMRNQPRPPWPDTRSPIRASSELKNTLTLRWRISVGTEDELRILKGALEELAGLIEEELR
jgi:hypothetical protein